MNPPSRCIRSIPLRSPFATPVSYTHLYFPTYALGSAYDAMFVPAMCRDGVDLTDACASGDLAPVRAWLGEHIWQWGRAKDAPELIKGACGMAFDARYYCSYLQDKFTTLYEL